MMFLLGKHAIFGDAPPTYFRSMEAVRLPSLAIVQAINLPPVPLPSTRTSYVSGSTRGVGLVSRAHIYTFGFGLSCPDLLTGTIRLRIPKVCSQAEASEDGTYLIRRTSFPFPAYLISIQNGQPIRAAMPEAK